LPTKGFASNPEIRGIDRFKGELFRAGRWPHHPVEFKGKRVGVLGTGSSGIQIVQAIGPESGEHAGLLQRSATERGVAPNRARSSWT
jgi:cation diffusion facilitator CzcD-associated flavoprotein CzcO